MGWDGMGWDAREASGDGKGPFFLANDDVHVRMQALQRRNWLDARYQRLCIASASASGTPPARTADRDGRMPLPLPLPLPLPW